MNVGRAWPGLHCVLCPCPPNSSKKTCMFVVFGREYIKYNWCNSRDVFLLFFSGATSYFVTSILCCVCDVFVDILMSCGRCFPLCLSVVGLDSCYIHILSALCNVGCCFLSIFKIFADIF